MAVKATTKIHIDFIEETVRNEDSFYKKVKPKITVEPIRISGDSKDALSQAVKDFNKRNKTRKRIKIVL